MDLANMDEDELDRIGAEYDMLDQVGNQYDEQNNRAQPNQGQNNKQRPLDPAVQWLAKQLQKSPKLNNLLSGLANSSTVQNINKGGKEVGGYTNPWVGGALQEVGDVGASLGNLALKPINALSGKEYNIPHPDLKQYQEPGLYNDLAFMGGQLGTGLVGGLGLGAGRGVAQAVQRLPRSGGWAGLVGDVGKGAAAGYALGENAEGDRTLGTALGAVAQPLTSITNRGITNRVLGDRAREEGRHGEMYRDIFGPANENNIPFTGERLLGMGDEAIEAFGRIRGRLGRDYREVIDNFLNEPSMENAQRLQSSLGQFARNTEKNPKWKTNSLPPGHQAAYDAATRLRNNLQGDIEGSLRRGGLPEEAAMYPEVTRSFAENVAPYRTQAISDVMEGVKHPHKLAKRLREDEKFMIELGERYPELGLNKLLPYASTGLATLGAYLGFPKVSLANEKKQKK
jgi:hypothetical protein